MAGPGPRTRVVMAARAALAAYGLDTAGGDEGSRLLGAMVESMAEAVDKAPAVRDRVAAARALLEVADRLDLVPSSPGTGRAGQVPPAGPAPADAGGEDDDDPFEVPDLPPGVGDQA